MLITEVIVDNNGCTIEWLPLYISLQAGSPIAKDIIIGTIADIIFGCLDLRNTARGVMITRSHLKGEIREYV